MHPRSRLDGKAIRLPTWRSIPQTMLPGLSLSRTQIPMVDSTLARLCTQLGNESSLGSQHQIPNGLTRNAVGASHWR